MSFPMTGHVTPDHALAQHMRGHMKHDGLPFNVTHFDGEEVHGEVEGYTFPGGYRVEADIAITDHAADSCIVGSSSTVPNYILIYYDNPLGWRYIRYGADGVIAAVVDFGVFANDALRHTVGVSVEGTEVSLAVDGVWKASGTDLGAADQVVVFNGGISNHLGAKYLTGSFPALRLYDLTLSTEPQLVRDYRFNRADGIIENHASGGALESPQIPTAGGAWKALGDDIYERSVAGSWNHLAYFSPLAGECHFLDVEILETYTGSLRYYQRNTEDTSNNATTIPDSEKISVPLLISVGDDTVRGVWLDSLNWTGKVRVTLRRAPGWGQLYNLAADSIQRYIETDDGDLVGSKRNQLSNPNDLTATEWLLQNSSVDDLGDHFRITYTGGTWSAVRQYPAIASGQLVTFIADYKADSHNRVRHNIWTGSQDLYVVIDLDTGDVLSTNSSGDCGAVALGDGWYRAYITVTTTGEMQAHVGRSDPTAVLDGTDSILARNPDLILGAYVPASPRYRLRKRIANRRVYRAGKTRVIPRFDGVGMRGYFPEWTASNYIIRIVHRRLDSGMTVNERILASEGHDAIYLNTSGTLAAKLTNAADGEPSYSTSTVSHCSSDLVESTVAKINDTVITGLNGEKTAMHERPGMAPISLSQITNTSFFEGEILLISLECLDNPLTNSHLYLLDTDTGVIYDALADDGAELIDAQQAIADAGTNFAIVDGRITCEVYSTWGQRQVRVPVVLEAGRVYEITADLVGANRLTVGFPTAETQTPTDWVSNGYYGCYKQVVEGRSKTILAVPTGADTTNAHIGIASTGIDNGTLLSASLSIVEKPNAGTIENAPSDAYPVFVYQGAQAQEWLSPQKASIKNSSDSLPYLGGTHNEWEYFDVGSVVPGTVCRISVEVEGASGGDVAGFSSVSGIPAAPPFMVYGGDSVVGGEYTASDAGPVRVFRPAGSSISFKNISVRELLKEAI